jgi:hypothetical protein
MLTHRMYWYLIYFLQQQWKIFKWYLCPGRGLKKIFATGLEDRQTSRVSSNNSTKLGAICEMKEARRNE